MGLVYCDAPASPTAEITYRTGKSFAPRAGAYVIDYFIMLPLTCLSVVFAAFPLGALFAILGHSTEGLQFDNLAAFIIGLIANVLYFALPEWLCGATPGKLLLRMRVVNDGSDRCSLGAALLRGLVRPIDGLVCGLVAYLNMHAPEYKRRGDKWAHTMVIELNDIPVERRRSKWWALLAIALYGFLMTSIYVIYMLAAWF